VVVFRHQRRIRRRADGSDGRLVEPDAVAAVTTHVLDTALGRPAEGVPVTLEAREPDGGWSRLAAAVTAVDGRAPDLARAEATDGVHRLLFSTGDYVARTGASAFFPEVIVVFALRGEERCHVPLLLSPYGYSTYRGS
jgi:5-hydroxyisourate hydrolase